MRLFFRFTIHLRDSDPTATAAGMGEVQDRSAEKKKDGRNDRSTEDGDDEDHAPERPTNCTSAPFRHRIGRNTRIRVVLANRGSFGNAVTKGLDEGSDAAPMHERVRRGVLTKRSRRSNPVLPPSLPRAGPVSRQ